MTRAFSRPVTRRSVLAGCRPARRQAWYIGWPWVCSPRAARRGVKPGIYMGPFFLTSRAWLQPPARDDPSLLGLSRAGLAGCRPARRQAWYGWPRVCRARALALRPAAGPPAERGPLVYNIRFFFKLDLLLLFFFKKITFFFFFFFQKYYKSRHS